jgi:hypothetical protein
MIVIFNKKAKSAKTRRTSRISILIVSGVPSLKFSSMPYGSLAEKGGAHDFSLRLHLYLNAQTS